MPYSFDFDTAHNILRCRLKNGVTDGVFQDFFEAGSQLAVRTQPGAGVVDFSEVTSFDVSTDTIRLIAKSSPVVFNPNLFRIVVAPAPDIFGMMRMFAMQSEETRPNLHVVHSEHEAWAILAVREPRFKPLDNE